MLSKVVAEVLNWLVLTVFIPAMAWIWDVWKLRKENKELKQAIKDLKDAKTQTDIDSAIDRIP